MATLNGLDVHDACREAAAWYNLQASFTEAYKNCERADWILWLFKRLQPSKLKELTLAKARCAETVTHLLKDERSIEALEVAIAFGNGEATVEEMANAAKATYATYAADAAAAAADAVKETHLKIMAEIVREYLPIELWELPCVN